MTTTLIDVKEVQELAKKEISKEATAQAVANLKELYRRKEKAELVVKNLDRDIQNYLAQIAELSVYASAGVNIALNGTTIA